MKSILVILEKRGMFGGAELATCLVLRALAEAGCRLTVLSGFEREELPGLQGVEVLHCPSLDVPSKPVLWFNLLKLHNTIEKLVVRHDVVYVPRISYSVIPIAKRKDRTVIVHLHDYQPLSYCACVFDHGYGDHFGIASDAIASLRYELREGHTVSRALASSICAPFNRFSRAWVREADHVICVSRKHLEIVRSALPELGGRLVHILNPIPEIPAKRKALRELTFLYAGGRSRAKGFEIYLRASESFLHRGHQGRFVTAGSLDREATTALESLNRRFPGSFVTVGKMRRLAFLGLHSTSHALVFPSELQEPLPFVVIEAMLCGTIPIASDIGGVPEIVQGSFAEEMVFEPGDADQCVDRLETVSSMSDGQMVEAGATLRQHVLQRFRPEVTATRLVDLINE